MTATSWILVVMIYTTSGQFVEKVAVGPYASKKQCQAAKFDGLKRFRLETVCVTQAHWEGKTVDPGVAPD
jgi:hypothetical protein